MVAQCFLCGELIEGPGVPRPKDDGTWVLLHPECWESCAMCCTPIKVFEPVSASVGMVTLYREARSRQVEVEGVVVHACDECATEDEEKEELPENVVLFRSRA